MTATLDPRSPTGARLLRIQEVATELGLTPRSIRYYEELGLLSPAARSQGAYRLYDASDVERLRFIKALRDDAQRHRSHALDHVAHEREHGGQPVQRCPQPGSVSSIGRSAGAPGSPD